MQGDEEALKGVYEEFVTAFDDTGKNLNKVWVKGGLANPKTTSNVYRYKNH